MGFPLWRWLVCGVRPLVSLNLWCWLVGWLVGGVHPPVSLSLWCWLVVSSQCLPIALVLVGCVHPPPCHPNALVLIGGVRRLSPYRPGVGWWLVGWWCPPVSHLCSCVGCWCPPPVTPSLWRWLVGWWCPPPVFLSSCRSGQPSPKGFEPPVALRNMGHFHGAPVLTGHGGHCVRDLSTPAPGAPALSSRYLRGLDGRERPLRPPPLGSPRRTSE